MQGRPHLNKVEKQNYSIPENNLINSFCFVKRASKWPKIEWYFNLVLVTSQRNTRHVLDALAINQKWHNCSGYHTTVLSMCTYRIITNLRILMDITIICIKYSQNATKYQAILHFNTSAYITVWHFFILDCTKCDSYWVCHSRDISSHADTDLTWNDYFDNIPYLVVMYMYSLKWKTILLLFFIKNTSAV